MVDEMSVNDPSPEPELDESAPLDPDRGTTPCARPREGGAAPVLVTDLASKTLAVKEGHTFLYSDLEGNLDHGGDYGLGLYAQDTRFLSHFAMTINGRQPILLSSSAERGYLSHIDLTNPDLFDGDALSRPSRRSTSGGSGRSTATSTSASA